MTTPQSAAFKRGATHADAVAVTHAIRRRRRLLAAAAGAVMSVVATTTLPFSATPAADRKIDDTATQDVQEVIFGGMALTDGVLGEPEVRSLVDAAPAEEPEAPQSSAPVAAVVEPDPCAEALAWVGEAGLPLPPGVGYHCPSTQFAHHGAACWNGSPCRGTGFIAINVELIGDASPEYIRHVVAHEVCHILDFQARGWTTEARADACAAAHGA